ncbi:hypothetical protein SAMN06265795_11166 [Noviherbaspirillum humi]|uniref:Amine oxidase domain-containing protein n=1 Tax=Noviherbaspirillum humi TaxID=1688639 RepID=A0A239J166_9BURK|nr:FAD-dependent oxidoreductase [Noviherbaspirillum humi]SNS99505.1 hypothetical protein SAMN06265795_11166 [Noviherbaspirillum humi]
MHAAIIGAGIAGLACAASLREAGIAVDIFEKSRGPGGRMSTRRGEGWQCDHGAQYFTARDPAFRAEVARWIAAGAAAPWQPRLAVFGGSGGHGSEGSPERFVGTPGMTAPARLLAAELALAARTTVNQIERDGAGWRLASAEHGWLPRRFDAVLLAVPAPQAVPLLQSSAPELAVLAARVRMRGCWSLMLRFDSRLPLAFDAAFINAGPLRWVARDSSKPGRLSREIDVPDTWLLHAHAEWSEAHIEDMPEAVAPILLQAFAALAGPAAETPQAWTAHRWRHADTDPPLERECAWDGGLGIGLCGDWIHAGKVEGAWLSGRALARELLRSQGVTRAA